MIYTVKIGKYTRKGNLQELVQRVVEFNGSGSELYDILKKSYIGLDVSVQAVEQIEKIESKEKYIKNQYGEIVIVDKKYSLSDFLTPEELNEWKKIKQDYEVFGDKITGNICRKLKSNPLVISTNIKALCSNDFFASLTFYGNILPKPLDEEKDKA